MKLLLIEDYHPLMNILIEGLRAKGYTFDKAYDGEEGLWFAQTNKYDAIVLDLMLPKMDGLRVLNLLRQEHNRTPVLILTAKGDINDRVKGLNAGADDYLVKPFSFRELLARLQALVRRSCQQASNIIQIEDFSLNTSNHSVWRSGKQIELTQKEYAILECLALRQGTIIRKQEIINTLYGFDEEIGSNVIDVHIMNLRRKIDHDSPLKLIHTKRGHGYCLGKDLP